MFDLVLSAVGIGLLLSLVLIGPVFFLLIETSLTKGWQRAIVLDAGVIAADILCISVAYFSSRDLANYIETHPSLYKIGGFFVFVYGLFLVFSKPNLHFANAGITGASYLKTFANGFLLNLLNIGVILFWFFIVSSITLSYPQPSKFLLYMSIVLGTFFAVDLIKIILARRVQSKMTDRLVYQIRRGIGVILLVFGLIIFLKGFGYFSAIDQQIEESISV